MKVAHAESHVLGSGGLQEVHTFKIRTSAHAFKILSSGMYSDKITAVLREIGCNAYDAHVEAKCPSTQFIVKLPNSIDSQFYIQDFGPGLSHNDVMELYTTYFASNKQNSNDFTGAFGLGSKSPFSYTDSFTISVSQDGLRRIYQAYIGEDGTPTIALMSQTEILPDDVWQRGLSVGFPVKPADYREFNHKAQRVFKMFDPLPSILGGDPIKPLNLTKDFGSYAFINTPEHADWQEKCYVKMGNVAYPVNFQSLGGQVQSYNRYSAKGQDALIACMGEMRGILFRFDMGSVQVASSREELQYDEDSQKFIKTRLGEVVKAIVKDIDALWSAAKQGTWADRAKFHDQVKVVTQGIWVTEELFKACGIKDSEELRNAVGNSHFALPDFKMQKAHYCVLQKAHRNVRGGGSSFWMKCARPAPAIGDNSIAYNREPLIVYGADSRPTSRIRKAYLEGALDRDVVLVTNRVKDVDGIKGTQADVEALLRKVRTAFKGIPEQQLCDFPAPPIIKYSKKRGMTPLPSDEVEWEGKQVSINSVPAGAQYYVTIQQRANWGNVRVKYFRKNGALVDHWAWNAHINDVMDIEKGLNIKIPRPVLIRKQDMKRWKIEMRPEWVLWEDHIMTVLADKGNLNSLNQQVGKHVYKVYLEGRSNDDEGFLDNMVFLKEKEPELWKLVEPVLKKHKVVAQIERVHKSSAGKTSKDDREPLVLTSYRNLVDEFGISVTTPEFKKAFETLSDKFPAAEGVTYQTFKLIGRAAPKILPVFIDALLTKGVA